MSVYKEGFRAVDTIETLSHKIYPDAADYGVPVNKGDSTWSLLQQLIESYGTKNTRRESKYSTGCQVTQEFTLMDEWNPSHTTFRYRLTYVQSTSGFWLDGKFYQGYAYIDLLEN